MRVNSITAYSATTPKSLSKETKQTAGAQSQICLPPPPCVYCNPVSFTGNRPDYQDRLKLRAMRKEFTPEAEELLTQSQKIAKKYNSPQIETWHLYLASLYEFDNYLKEIDEGLVKPSEEARFNLPATICMQISPTSEPHFMLSDKKNREKMHKVTRKHIKSAIENFAPKESGKTKKHAFSAPAPSKNTIGDMFSAYSSLSSEFKTENFPDDYLYLSGFFTNNRKLAREGLDYVFDLQSEMLVGDRQKEKHHLDFYDDKADKIWKNIALDNDVVLCYDSSDPQSAKHLVSSFTNLINKPGQNYKNLNPEKTEVIVLNDNAEFSYLNELVSRLKSAPKDEDKTTVVVANFITLLTRAGAQLGIEELKTLQNEPVKGRNVRLLFTMDSDTYFANTAKGANLGPYLKDYSIQTLPSMNAGDAKKYLTNQNGTAYIKNITKKDFSQETINKAIEVTSSDDGNYPDKATQLLSSVSKYFVDKEEITPADVEAYVTETKSLQETKKNAAQMNIVYDTGKRLSDIVGSPMTKADAESIVNQIKTKKIGTKGFMAYLEDGSSYGGGRKHTAQAIAGEAGIPMITINAQDFALKEIDALAQNADLPELKIKRLVSSAVAQAEANENKTAMIYIENFDNFGSNPLYGISSIYEQKAFSQLLSEMDNARKTGKVNLVVVGSVNMPELIDENIMKPYKFLNTILIYPPQDTEQRREVLNYYVNKMNLNIDDDKTIENMAETTAGFTVVDTIYLLETVGRVSKERGKDKIDLSDFTEAYLQTVTGRPNPAYMSDSDKRVVTSHEAGHALNLQLMYEIAEKQEIPWHLPDKVNFITLDPRGNFGGAMFPKSSGNGENNFETVMSDLICSYGGHSAEKTIYNQSGSWGITGDMQQVDALSKLAVLNMGMGPKTGVGYIGRKADGSPDVSEKKLEKIEDDIDSFKKCALDISDDILEAYKDFILEFTEKYYKKAGSGECIVPAETFQKELNKWREKQPDSKKQELNALELDILDRMEKTKKGEYISSGNSQA